MFSIAIVLLLLLFAAVLAVIGVVVYFILYQKRINQALVNPMGNQRKWPSPGKVALIFVGVILVLFVVFLLIKRGSGATEGIDEMYWEGKYDFKTYSAEEMTGYLANYSIEENEGYTKEVEEIGDIRFTKFISDQPYDTFHPQFVMYVEYIGDDEAGFYGYDGKFCTDEMETICGMGAAGSDYTDYFVVIGSSTVPCYFTYDAYIYPESYYESGKKSEDFADGTVAFHQAAIWLDRVSE